MKQKTNDNLPINGFGMNSPLPYSERGCPQNLSALCRMIDSEERVLEFILIHRLLGPVPPELMKSALELAKKFIADPSKFVPGGKLIASYAAYAQSVAVCIMEAPSVDALMPFLEQFWAVGWETEVIPAEKMEAVIPKMEKMLAQMAGS